MINYGDVSMQIGDVNTIFNLLRQKDLERVIDWLSEYSDIVQRTQKCIKHILSCLGQFDIYDTLNLIYLKDKSPNIHYSLKLIHVGNGVYRTDYIRLFDSDKVAENRQVAKLSRVLQSSNKAEEKPDKAESSPDSHSLYNDVVME
jgi:hypothetical protein